MREDIPSEINYSIALNVDPLNIMNLCRTNKWFRLMCQNEYFWKIYSKKWINPRTKVSPKKRDETWRQAFIRNLTIPIDRPDDKLLWNSSFSPNTYLNISSNDKVVVLVPIIELDDEYFYYPYNHRIIFEMPGTKTQATGFKDYERFDKYQGLLQGKVLYNDLGVAPSQEVYPPDAEFIYRLGAQHLIRYT